MRPSRTIIGTAFLVLGALCAFPTSTWAVSDTVVVDQPVKYYELFLHQERPALFNFSSPILKKTEPHGWKVEVDVQGSSMLLFAAENATTNDLTGQLTIECKQYTLVIVVRPAESLEQTRNPILVKHLHLLQIMQAAATQHAQKEIASAKAEMQATLAAREVAYAKETAAREKAHARELFQTKQQEGELALLREHGGSIATIEFAQDDACSEVGTLAICPVHWSQLGERGVLRVEIFNGLSRTVDVNQFEAFGQGSTDNRAGAVRIEDSAPMPRGEARAQLRSMQRVMASIVVRDARTLGHQVQVLLTGPNIRPAVRHIDLRPKPGEGLITLSFQGIAGAVWLANPIETDQLGATFTRGLGLRVRYGFNRRWSFEGELAGTTSGNVEFDGMEVGGEEGNLVRNASLGRFLATGLLHFGDNYRPIIRAGLGFQGVGHDSRFTPAAGLEREGPGSEFEMAGLWTFGVGFEAKLGRHWTAGIGAMFVGSATSTSPAGLKTSFEGGLNLSYGWTPR